MACGCSTDGAGGGPLLTGTLDPAFGSPASPAQQQENLLGSDTAGSSFSLAGFFVAGLIVALIAGAAWVLDKARKEKE